MRLISWIYVALGLGVLAGGYGLFSNPPGDAALAVPQEIRLPVVEVAIVGASDRVPTVRQTALLRAASELIVTTEATGRVVWINPAFELGGRIAAGDRIFALDDTRLAAEVTRAEADVAAAEAEFERLSNEAARANELAARGVSSEATLGSAQSSVTVAEARLLQAVAARDVAEIAFDQATAVAPFDAVVTAETLSLGQFLQPGTEVGRLVSADSAELIVRLNAEQFIEIQTSDGLVGQRVEIIATDGSGAQKTGEIRAVGFSNESATQTTAVLVSVDDPFEPDGGVFRLNTLMEVAIVANRDAGEILTVPAEAVQTGDRIWAIRDGQLRAVEATIERRMGDLVIIETEDLAIGDQVLLTRLPEAVDGLQVRVAEGGQ